MEVIRKKCDAMIRKQIKADLTTGMRDNEKKPWSGKAIQDYIESREQDIQKVLELILEDAKEEMDDWKNPLMEWIREYLYEDLEGYNDFIGEQWGVRDEDSDSD